MITKYIRALFFVALGLITIFALLLLFNLLFNYGTITLGETKPGSTTTINGKVTQKSAKLKPGDYSVLITNKDFGTYYQSVTVDRFKTVAVKPIQIPLNTKEIVAGALGFNPKDITDTDISDIKLFDNGKLMAGTLSQGGYSLFVVEYRDNGWKPVYYTGGGYQQILDLITNKDAQKYIKDLDARYSSYVQ